MDIHSLRSTTLGACLLAALAIGVLAAAASPAQAATCHLHLYGETCESETEHAEFQAFANCPFAEPEAQICSWALSSYTEMWPSKKIKEEWEKEHEKPAPGLTSRFKAGNVTVALKQRVTLRGAFSVESEPEKWFGAEGAPTIEPVAQVAAPITKDVDTTKLSPEELNRYNYFVKIAKETKVTATVELAGPASAIQVNLGNLLGETGTAFAFPVKVKLNSAFGGSNCYVGSEANPILVEFTTGESGALHGKAGSILKFDKGQFIGSVLTDTLVASTFASPGVEGCGVNGGADEAIDSALGLPSATGNEAILNGTLKIASAEQAKLGLEGKL
jgi:hypothetical protein